MVVEVEIACKLFRCGLTGKPSIPFTLGFRQKFDRHDTPLQSLDLVRRKRADTVGEFKSAEMRASHIPALKAKKRGKLAQEKVLLEPLKRFANSIRAFCSMHSVEEST